MLQDLLRRTLQSSDRHQVTLAEEMRFVNQYLELEKVRFLDRMSVEETIAPDTLSAIVPAFLLQPIVENAVIHGVASTGLHGRVHISAAREKNHLTITVQDNGPGLFDTPQPKYRKRDGIGLKITRERLAYMFGNDQHLSIENAATGGVQVRITIPFQQVGTRDGLPATSPAVQNEGRT